MFYFVAMKLAEKKKHGDRIETSPVYELLSGKPKEIQRRGREERKHPVISHIRQRKENNGKWSVQENERESKRYRSRSRSRDGTNNKSSTKSDAPRPTPSGVLHPTPSGLLLSSEIEKQKTKHLKRKLNDSLSDCQTKSKIIKRQLH